MQEFLKRFFTLLLLRFGSSLIFLFSAKQNSITLFSPYPPVFLKPLTTQISLKKRYFIGSHDLNGVKGRVDVRHV